LEGLTLVYLFSVEREEEESEERKVTGSSQRSRPINALLKEERGSLLTAYSRDFMNLIDGDVIRMIAGMRFQLGSSFAFDFPFSSLR
jgi:hypothetical protein